VRVDGLQHSEGERRIHVIQGKFVVTDDVSVVLTTILGSCVSACIRDPAAAIGGMNHFLLPGEGHQRDNQQAVCYGVYAMELLVNALLQRGAQRNRLEAKLFGGGHVLACSNDIGAQNADFAQRFLRHEGLNLVAASLRGYGGRRIQYWPVSGRARQIMIERDDLSLFTPGGPPLETQGSSADVELF
jgi:chemotaxis protein CheD